MEKSQPLSNRASILVNFAIREKVRVNSSLRGMATNISHSIMGVRIKLSRDRIKHGIHVAKIIGNCYCIHECS